MRAFEFLREGVNPKNMAAFQRWFGNSKIVDKAGQPLIVFHGTNNTFASFDPERSGSEKYSDCGKGIYLTPSHSNADYYREEAAANADEEANKMWQELEKMEKSATWQNGSPTYPEGYKELMDKWRKKRNEARQTSGSIVPLYASIQNPLVIEYQSTPDPYAERRAKEQNKDGIIVLKPNGTIDEIVAFYPTQVKSAYGNNGQYSSADTDITH